MYKKLKNYEIYCATFIKYGQVVSVDSSGWMEGRGWGVIVMQALLVDFMYTGRHMSYRQPVVLCVHIFYTCTF